ncbi:O-antigen translocase [Acinetobacter larvae]|uniref:O-antigen translocase n=1 Tax=Acinetobacter larvae TaxID=1789224 RepID=A0A1B2LVQ4_9GAMM|nr:O-antigen translocase [Acinetobacter larvae]AOA56994.1 O-antigen translocase [Acinetobacter larvae]
MGLFKTSILNGIAVLIRTLTMFILNKILAVYVGPAGYAAIGQFQNFIQMITAFAGGAINNGIIKYTAEYHEDAAAQRRIWQTAGSLVLIFSFVFSILLLLFHQSLSSYLFKRADYAGVLLFFAIFLVFFNLNTFLLAILNGKKEIPKLVLANILGSIFSLLLTSALAIFYGIYGALIALSIYQSLAFLVTFLISYRAPWFQLQHFYGKVDPAIASKFLAFAAMALVSAICVPLSQMVIRDYLSHQFNSTYAGYWEAMIRLSSAYLLLVTTTLSVYYLPRLSELTQLQDIKKEIYIGYKFIFPLAVLAGLVAYGLRDWVITLLYTPQFHPMRDLFFWQMLGDALKIGSWILAYLMLSKAMTRLFITTEIIFALTSIAWTYICTQLFGFEGVSIAHVLNYGVYWLVIGFCIFSKLNNTKEA